MKRYLLGALGLAFAILAALAAFSPAIAQSSATGSVSTKWHTTALIDFTLTPNYYTGYGAVPAEFGTQPAPTHGPYATGVGAGSVDFGTTLAGKTYLYKYAAHLHVTSNDAAGFFIYGEAAINITNSTDGTTYPVSQALFYLPSGATSDSNTGFSPGFPFQLTSGAVSGGTYSTPPTIAYTTYPPPIASSNTDDGDYYYDYEFKVPSDATAGNVYYVWIVYTVIGQ
ncbi:MAG TPA: hypothetical protein VMF11_06245 [Candidatus Baltobacteraceae bacterium]|nr:hypothetical protein [Candidatus Baltobacteraceae bacterium]